MRQVLKEPFYLNGVLFGNPGDVIQVTDAIPGIFEDWEDVVGYCDIYNETTRKVCWGTWLDVEDAVFEPVKTREDVLARIQEYYEEEFGNSEIEDVTDMGLAYTELYPFEAPPELRWDDDHVRGVRISLDLNTLTAAICLGGRVVDKYTFENYDSLYEWVNCFEFENIFSLKIL